MDHAKTYLNDMKYQVKVCNSKFLAAYTANAINAMKDAFIEGEISMPEVNEFREEVDKIIDSFDKNCTCRERLIKKK